MKYNFYHPVVLTEDLGANQNREKINISFPSSFDSYVINQLEKLFPPSFLKDFLFLMIDW